MRTASVSQGASSPGRLIAMRGPWDAPSAPLPPPSLPAKTLFTLGSSGVTWVSRAFPPIN
eukprot:10111070-Heterocapsa_arctica.AAC.1